MSGSVVFSRNKDCVVTSKPKGPRSKLKNALLAGTALVGIGLFPGGPRSATITYTNGENDATNYTLSEDSTFETVSGGTETAEQSGTIDLGSFTATIDPQDLSDLLTISGIISGSGGLAKIGSGTLILPGPNTFTGGAAISSGRVEIQNNLSLGSGTITFSGGQLVLAEGLTLANDIDLFGGPGQIQIADAAGPDETISGNINTSADGAPHRIVIDNTGVFNVLNVTGVISGSGSVLYEGGARNDQTTIISGSNTYAGYQVAIPMPAGQKFLQGPSGF